MRHYVAAIDGIPGIMPGTVTVPPPPVELEEDNETVSSVQTYNKVGVRAGVVIPKYKRRMMLCNRTDK